MLTTKDRSEVISQDNGQVTLIQYITGEWGYYTSFTFSFMLFRAIVHSDVLRSYNATTSLQTGS